MITVSIKISEEMLKHLKKLSHSLSLERDADLSLSDIIREALNNTYPMLKDVAEVGSCKQ